MSDSVYMEFLRGVARDAERCNCESRILRLAPVPASGNPPGSYQAIFSEIEHLERAADGTARVSARPIPAVLQFPADYLRSVDPTLQFRVVRVNAPLLHPNCRVDGTLCLGNRFQPGTSLRPLLETIHGIFSSRIVATDNAFDAKARDYFVSHVEEVRRLRDRAPSLWHRALATEVRTERLEPGAREGGTRP
jgi:hypothetical protein